MTAGSSATLSSTRCQTGLPPVAGVWHRSCGTVGLQLPNIPQFLIAYFGMLKAGCVPSR